MNAEMRIKKIEEKIKQRKPLREKLYMSEITMSSLAAEAGVSRTAVWNFFNGTMNSQKIENAIHRLLADSDQQATG